MKSEVRQYQVDAIAGLRRSIGTGHKRPVLVAPTGAGKTHMAAEVIKGAAAKGNRVLVLAPRRELIYQFSRKLHSENVDHGILMAGVPYNRYPTVVASFDTLHARAVRTDRIAMPRADVVIVDEAHLSIAETRQNIINHYSDSIIIGLTATPARSDGRGLGIIYDDMVVTTNIGDLINQGYLAPIRYYASVNTPDLSEVKLNKDGDYVEAELAAASDDGNLIGDIVDNWKRIASDRQTVVFAVNRAHSRHICDQFNAAGYKAEHLDGETPLDERADILKRVENGETQILCNVFVATFGLDIPILSCAILARATKNISLYLQTGGRVLRVHPDVPDAIIIDHCGNIKENGFLEEEQPWALDGTETVKERKEREKKEKKEPKEITCGNCGFVFKGLRICPKCGHQMIPSREEIPHYEEDLQEVVLDVDGEAKLANRKHSWELKVQFMSELKGYSKKKGYKDGWAAWQYKERYGVWPNDPRVNHAEPIPPSDLVKGWIQHQNIKRRHRK